ncbi:hypothetical protein AB7250_19070 [Providencia stuartii]|uniref:hypothetical protein n=1 Tax=Providencia TaxID=586 RepID=UPI000DE797FE|nr:MULTISPECIES: hypothetical protein [Providencia]MDN0012510.1 hypothetical protein [Providencia stuartii]MDT1068327.1 hypothetical protein [Providencia stuartii]SST04530.1 Uncharacterised protein [Acinetobacter baumannii]
MAIPQSKGDDILFELEPSMKSGKFKLFPLQVAKIKREINSLDDYAYQDHLNGIIALLDGDISKGNKLCLSAIESSPETEGFWGNYAMVLRNVGLLKKHFQVIEESVEHAFCYDLLTLAVYAGITTLNLELVNDALAKAHKLEMNKAKLLNKASMQAITTISNNKQMMINQIKPMVDILIDVVDGEYTGNYGISIKEDMDGIVGYRFIVDIDPDKASKLNDILFDKIYESGIDDSGCFVFIDSGVNDEH